MVPVSGPGRNLFQSHIGRFLWRYGILNPLGPPNHNNNARIFYYRTTHGTTKGNNERSLEDLLETDLDSLKKRFYLFGNSGFWILFIVLSQLVVEGVFGPSGPKSPKLYRTGSDSFLSKNKNHTNRSWSREPKSYYFYLIARNSSSAFSSGMAAKIFTTLSHGDWVSFNWSVSTLLVWSQLGVCAPLKHSAVTSGHNFFDDCGGMFFSKDF